jgi:hypothetical protein
MVEHALVIRTVLTSQIFSRVPSYMLSNYTPLSPSHTNNMHVRPAVNRPL